MRIASFIACAGLCIGLLAGCDGCENKIAQDVTSPSGAMRAVVFHRGCGATVGFNTQISIIRASQGIPTESGNTAIVEGKSGPQVLWDSETKLRIAGLGSGRIYKAEQSVGGVSVTYAQ